MSLTVHDVEYVLNALVTSLQDHARAAGWMVGDRHEERKEERLERITSLANELGVLNPSDFKAAVDPSPGAVQGSTDPKVVGFLKKMQDRAQTSGATQYQVPVDVAYALLLRSKHAQVKMSRDGDDYATQMLASVLASI